MADVGSAVVAAELGYTQRHISTLAASGKIPSAYRVTDTSEWRFNLSRVRAWRREREVLQCQISSSAEASGGALSGWPGATRRNHYEQQSGYGPPAICSHGQSPNGGEAINEAMERDRER